MNDHLPDVVVCVECNGLAEPPLTRVYDPYGLPTSFFICQSCRDALIREEEGYDPEGDEE